jgi:hypothetical protein
MEELFGTLGGLIPIALIIALRLFSAMKKQQRASTPPPERKLIFPEEPEETKKSFRPHWEEAKPPFHSSASPFPIRPELPREQKRKPDRERKPEAKPQKKLRETIKSAFPEAPASGLLKSTDAPVEKAPLPTPSFFTTLERYTPLRRAIVMAEIIGPPKGS